MSARHLWLPLALLAACSSPPLTADAEIVWVDAPCGSTQLDVNVTTRPGAQVELTNPSMKDYVQNADADGEVSFRLGRDEVHSGTKVNVTDSGEYARPSLGIPTALVSEHFDTGMWSTVCRGGISADTKACIVNVYAGRLSVVGADALKIGAVEGAPPGEGRESLEAAIPPMAVLAWDLAPFRDKAECASVRVDDVSVTKKGRTYQGSVRLGEEVALGTLTQVLSDAIDGEPVSTPATGDAAIVFARTKPGGPAYFRKLVGAPGPATDIRTVVAMTPQDHTLGSCGMYVDPDSGDKTEMFEKRKDLHVAILDRVSGEVREETTIQGKRTGCSRIAVTQSPCGSDSFRAKLPEDKAMAWIDERVK